jgi:3',5'-cyclic AMP phosphodiesterase CpdA
MIHRILSGSLGTLLFLAASSCSSQPETLVAGGSNVLRVFAVGDVGEKTGELRANAGLIERMETGQHDGGKPDMMIFLGDNFYDTGLNLRADDVEDKVEDILGSFGGAIANLGRESVHAIPGNHDYYTSHALETSILFGLVSFEVGPFGVSDKGNQRAQKLEQWTYHFDLPGQTILPLSPGSKDSVQFVFFDSARLLRTEPRFWSESIAGLRRMLSATAKRGGIRWRVLAAHHPFYSLGEHGGYTVWNDETETVEYLTPCDKDSNAISWLKNFIDPEDVCADRYTRYVDSVKFAIARSGAKVHMVLSGHDHDLQLLSYPERNPECPECPDIHIVSGAGAKTAMVRHPAPPREYTASQAGKMGISESGFAMIEFSPTVARVVFFNGRRGEAIDMGGGKRELLIGADGLLVPE